MSKSQKPTAENISDNIPTQKENDPKTEHQNFIDDLTSYFTSKAQIKEAYFGYLFDQQQQHHLFTVLDIEGEEKLIVNKCGMIKARHFPQLNIKLATNLSNPDIVDNVKAGNFAFYEKGKSRELEVAILKQWFEKERFYQEFLDTLYISKTYVLLKNFDKQNSVLDFQTYIKGEREFTPMFSSRFMIYKSGMVEIPDGLTVVELDFGKMTDMLGDAFKKQFFILNPGTPFQVEINS